MSKYIRLQGTAARLIKSNGGSFQVRKPNPGTPDPVTGTVSRTPVVQAVDAVILLFGGQVKNNPIEGFLGENGIRVLSKMNNIIFSASGLDFPLEPGQEIYYEDSWWIIEYVSPLKPDGKTTVIYKGFIRRP
tara:strand:- start:10082 stop:10477 length:396 start_codon:yes stop_codon:yes gene_type:complete